MKRKNNQNIDHFRQMGSKVKTNVRIFSLPSPLFSDYFDIRGINGTIHQYFEHVYKTCDSVNRIFIYMNKYLATLSCIISMNVLDAFSTAQLQCKFRHSVYVEWAILFCRKNWLEFLWLPSLYFQRKNMIMIRICRKQNVFNNNFYSSISWISLKLNILVIKII